MTWARFKYYAKMTVHGALVLPAWPNTSMSSLSVFTYHSFCAQSKPPASFPSLPVSVFERQIGILKKHYRIVSLSEGIRRLSEAEHGRPMAAITLDDGFVDNYRVAWPALLRGAVPATIFVATDFIDRQRVPWPTRLMDIANAIDKREASGSGFDSVAWRRHYKEALRVLPAEKRFEELERLASEHKLDGLPERPAMSWAQIREMQKSGIEFGSHTVFHGLLPFLEEAEVASELADSKRRIEDELQTECEYFAYPNGDHDLGVSTQVENSGYRAALTQEFGTNIDDMETFRMRRIEVPYHDPISSFSFRARKSLARVGKVLLSEKK